MEKQQQESKVADQREKALKRSEWMSKVKYTFLGAILGIAGTFIIGLSSDGLVTGSNADRMAREARNDGVTTALAPICVANFQKSSDYAQKVKVLKDTSYWLRADFIADGGWSDTAAGEGSDLAVNKECAQQIIAAFDVAKKAAGEKSASAEGS